MLNSIGLVTNVWPLIAANGKRWPRDPAVSAPSALSLGLGTEYGPRPRAGRRAECARRAETLRHSGRVAPRRRTSMQLPADERRAGLFHDASLADRRRGRAVGVLRCILVVSGPCLRQRTCSLP